MTVVSMRCNIRVCMLPTKAVATTASGRAGRGLRLQQLNISTPAAGSTIAIRQTDSVTSTTTTSNATDTINTTTANNNTTTNTNTNNTITAAHAVAN